MKTKVISAAAALALALSAASLGGAVTASAADSEPAQMEYLNRGAVAVKTDNGVFVSWRLLGTESYDTSFDVYKNGEFLTNITDSTNYTDPDGKNSDVYTVVTQGAALKNAVTKNGASVSVSAAESGLTAFAAKYNGSVLDKVWAKSAETGNYDYRLDFEPDKVFLWNGMTPAETGAADEVSVLSGGYLDIPIQLPPDETIIAPDGETVGTFPFGVTDCSAADLDGDGEYEIITKMVSSEHDVGSPGDGIQSLSGTVRFNAYKLDGTRMWERDINLGKNVYSSAHTVQFLAYDFNLDGKAELICQSSLGSTDAAGNYVSHAAKTDAKIAAYTDEQNESTDFRGTWGPITQGDEFLTVFDGETGEAIDTIAFPTARVGSGESFGDTSGNRSNRFIASVAYLDGQKPYAVYLRGYYFGRNGRQRTGITGTSFDGEKLSVDYRFDTEKGQPGYYSGAEIYVGNGNHNCAVADVDGDGRDEFLTGALCMEVKDDNTFKPRWCTFMEHGDALHLGDYDPTHAGMEFFTVHEDGGPNTMSGQEIQINYGMSVIDADSGGIIKHWESGSDNGRGIMANIGAGGYYQVTSANAGTYRADGGDSFTAGNYGMSMNFRVFWDGDAYDELLDGVKLTNWNGRTMARVVLPTNGAFGSVNGTKANPSLQADLFGDWREEIVYPTTDGKALRVFTTTDETSHKLYTLMHDRAYRMQVSSEQTAYNQPPHIGYYISDSDDRRDARKSAAYIKTVHDGVTAMRDSADVTIRFIDTDGNQIRENAVTKAPIGSVYFAGADYLKDLNYDEATKMCYRYKSGNDGVTVTKDGENTVTLVFEYVESEISYSVNAVDGDGNVIKVLKSGDARPGEVNVSCYADYGIVSDGKYYALADNSENYVSFTPASDDKTREIVYNEVNGSGAELNFDDGDISAVSANDTIAVAMVGTNDSVIDRDINGPGALKVSSTSETSSGSFGHAALDLSAYAANHSKVTVSYDAYFKYSSGGRMAICLLDTDPATCWDGGWYRVHHHRPGGSKGEGLWFDGNNEDKSEYRNKWIRGSFSIDLNTGYAEWMFTDRETGEKIPLKTTSRASELRAIKSLSLMTWQPAAFDTYIDNISVIAYD